MKMSEMRQKNKTTFKTSELLKRLTAGKLDNLSKLTLLAAIIWSTKLLMPSSVSCPSPQPRTRARSLPVPKGKIPTSGGVYRKKYHT